MLAECDHRYNHGREDFRLLERLSDRITTGDRGAGLHDGVLNDAVAGRLRRNLESLENADTGADKRAERSREARHRGLAQHVAQDREMKHCTVDHELSRGGSVILPEHVSAGDDYGANHPPVGPEEA